MPTDAEIKAAVAHLKQTTTGYLKKDGTPKAPPWPEGSAHWAPALDLLEGSTPTPDPVPPPPTSSKLRWAPGPTDTSADLRWPRERRTSSIGEIKGRRNVVAIAGEMITNESNEGHIIPRENTGTFHWEGWRVICHSPADAFTGRWRTPRVHIQACEIDVTDGGGDHHSDGWQTQEAIEDFLGFDRCTIRTDYQGVFLSNEPQKDGPEKSRVSAAMLSRVLFRVGEKGWPQTWFFKAFPPRPGCDPIGTVEMYDVWAPDPAPAFSAVSKVYPQWSSWTGADRSGDYYGTFIEQRRHRNGRTYAFQRFSVAGDTVPMGNARGQAARDCGIRGEGGLWLYSSLADVPADVGAPANVGFDYVSPGYL